MSVFTKGQIAVTPLRLHTDLTLEQIAARARDSSYPQAEDGPSVGWGSPLDDDEVIGAPVGALLTAGRPQLLNAVDHLPERLRLRLYWDVLDRSAYRSVEAGASWERFNTRDAVDVVLFDEPDRNTIAAIVSSRDRRKVKAHAHRELENLIHPRSQRIAGMGRLEFDNLDEELDHDFFAWLLYKLNLDKIVGDGLDLDVIDEISSKDRNLRGARFTDRATLERVELAALITMGNHKFGPAKVSINASEPDAAIEMQLELDGGFRVYRSSSYDDRQVPDDELGHALVEDLWTTVIPRIRSAYASDGTWRSTGRGKLKSDAVALIRSILPK